jgi:DNA-binding transcriptional regulator YiaG
MTRKKLESRPAGPTKDPIAIRGRDEDRVGVRRVPLTARSAFVEEAPAFDRDRIVRIRERLNLSQPVFASALNVSPETVKAWEQGKRVPDGAALRLLQFADEQPALILRAVREEQDEEGSAAPSPQAYRANPRGSREGRRK